MKYFMSSENTQPEKLSNTSIIIAVITVVVIVGYVFYGGGKDSSDSINYEDIQITEQKNFYGISGRILEVRDNSIIIETATLSYGDYNPQQGDRWIWEVFISNNTEVFKFAVDERKVAEGNPEHMTLAISTPEILKGGDLVTVTGNNDIGIQFASDEKYIRALKIEVY